ncbi:MAG: LLM class F420-dependent oxidoreductase [Gammaproteobacteria bacterium]|nr:LLM class F420-dependent oxidoreductase [Gammaproteobacteria bacterium]
MEIGIVFPHNEIGTDPGAIKAWAQGAEALGMGHMLIYDHVLGADPDRPGGFRGPYDKDVAFHEPFSVFSFMAAVTNTITFMTAVLILPQRQTALVAKQAAELAILSGNRFRLGIGTGWNEVEYEALSVPFAGRGARQSEQVELMRQLWREDSLTFDGKHHTVTRASILPRPTESVPIWFGGIAPALLRRCARLGDGWVPLGGPNDASAEALATIKEHREAVGLPWEGFGIQAQAQYRGGTPERWQNHASRWQNLGCTHLAIATHNAGNATVEDHLRAAGEYLDAVRSI